MTEVECSGTDLEEQRRHHEEIVPAHENDLDILPVFAKPLEVTGRENSTEAAAEDHNLGLCQGLPPSSNKWASGRARARRCFATDRRAYAPPLARIRQYTSVHCVAGP